MAKHTPGPWEVSVFDDMHEIRMGSALGGATSYSSIHLIEYQHGIDDLDSEEEFDEADANARLIAASPIVLAALKGLLDAAGDYLTTCPEVVEAVDVARAAIRAAEGEGEGE